MAKNKVVEVDEVAEVVEVAPKKSEVCANCDGKNKECYVCRDESKKV